MTTTSQERKLFNKYKQALVSKLGNKALDNVTIDKVCRVEFAAWGGCVPSDRVVLKPFHYYIVNVDNHDQPGSHWLAVFTSAKRAYIYDSYARDPASIVFKLLKTISKKGFKLSKTDLVHNMEQIGYNSEVCGQISMAWLLVVRDLGISRERNI